MNYGTKQGHFLGYWKVILVHIRRWSHGIFQDDNNIFHKMKNDLSTGTRQDNIWCPINIILLCTSDDSKPGNQLMWNDNKLFGANFLPNNAPESLFLCMEQCQEVAIIAHNPYTPTQIKPSPCIFSSSPGSSPQKSVKIGRQPLTKHCLPWKCSSMARTHVVSWLLV